MKVKDHNLFRKFEYENYMENKNFQLGEILINIDIANKVTEDFGNPIGVVIQLHTDGDCRTDMFGNTSPSENRLATFDEIQKYRPELVSEFDIHDSCRKAKALLKSHGYYTDNLWTVADVQAKFECTDEQAQGVLHGALQNDATMEQIWFAIDFHGENDGLTKKLQSDE